MVLLEKVWNKNEHIFFISNYLFHGSSFVKIVPKGALLNCAIDATPFCIDKPLIFSANFHSGSVARSRKPIECMLKTVEMLVVADHLQKAVDTTASNCDCLRNSCGKADYEKEQWRQTPLSESNTNGERSWSNSPDTDTNFWAGIQWLQGQ